MSAKNDERLARKFLSKKEKMVCNICFLSWMNLYLELNNEALLGFLKWIDSLWSVVMYGGCRMVNPANDTSCGFMSSTPLLGFLLRISTDNGIRMNIVYPTVHSHWGFLLWLSPLYGSFPKICMFRFLLLEYLSDFYLGFQVRKAWKEDSMHGILQCGS